MLSGSSRHVRRQSGHEAKSDDFETAADAVVTGDSVTLTALLRRRPDLVTARSERVHRATLLHYVAANGVEDFRQKTPPNALDVARLLLDAGAEVDALANTYGGGPAQTTLNLLVSSVHPAIARLQAPLAEMLLDRGAALNGVADDGSPLLTALAFGYARAMYAIAGRGARIDGPIPAAALGRSELVRRFVRDRETLAPHVRRHGPPWFHAPENPTTHIEHAFIAACKFGHADVARYFLDLGVTVAARDDMTPLHWAAAHRYADVVRLLLTAGAPLEERNTWGGTVLDSTIWFAKNPPIDHPYGAIDVGYIPILKLLIEAGANVEEVYPFPTGDTSIDELLIRHGHTGTPKA
jgi:ankyrin repeat protein